ncbi:MAG: hypothetical protein ACTSPB_01700 [Candidatus Thorarchaeota archaeon]
MELLNSYSTTNAFAWLLHEQGILQTVRDVFYFYDAPYKWQQEYEDIMGIIADYYGTDDVSITEAIDVDAISQQVSEYFYDLE